MAPYILLGNRTDETRMRARSAVVLCDGRPVETLLAREG